MITDDKTLSKLGMECALKIVALDISDDLREVHENLIKTAKILRIITAELKDNITNAGEEGESHRVFTAGDIEVCNYLDNSLIPLMRIEKSLSEVVENYNDIFTGFMRTAMPKPKDSASCVQMADEIQEDHA